MERSQSLSNTLNDVKYEQYINNLHDRLPSLIVPNEIDCNRWPWELVQNAKDTVVKRDPSKRFVDVKFIYYKDENGKEKFCFEHNGDQFTDKAITGLIWKFSAEKRNEQFTEDGLSRDKQSTGRFGTGFMTTHALSLTVDISGSYYNGDPGVERNVSVEFTLHREGPTDEDYKRGVKQTEDEMVFDRIPIPEEGILPTKFIYHLRNDINKNATEIGLENVRLNAAQTMLFCPTVRSIIVDDKINGNYYKIVRKISPDITWGDSAKNKVKETVFTVESSNENDCKERHFISIEIEEKSEALSSFWYPNERNLRLHVAVEVDENKRILTIPSTSPSIYCSLPLIGYERLCLPFYVNSNDFEPTTERKSLYLNQRRSKVDYDQVTNKDVERVVQNGVNWSILERSVPLYERIVDFLIEKDYSNRFNLAFGLSQILRNSWTDEEKNCLAARFILPIRSMLMDKKLVKTESGYFDINSGVKFIECAKDRDRGFFYEICTGIYDSITVAEENQQWVDLKWSKFRFAQDFEEKPEDENNNPEISTIKFDDVASYIEKASTLNDLVLVSDQDKLEWLNKFYLWIANSKLPILSQKAIVPNRKGNFCSCEPGCDLRDGSDISTGIFDFLKTIDIDWDDHLLMDGITNVSLTKETTENVTTAIRNKSKEIIDNGDDVISKLLPILLALPADSNNASSMEFRKKRERIISILSTMYSDKVEGKGKFILELKSGTWELADKWFMSTAAKEIARRSTIDIVNEGDSEDIIKGKYCTISWLSDTLCFMFDENYLHQNDITGGNDNSIAVIPNRYGQFKFVNELFLQDSIPDEFLNDALKNTGFDIKEVLLYKDFKFSNKITISKYTISTIASIYNDFFASESDDSSKELVSNYLLHLIPECGNHYASIRKLYDRFEKSTNTETKTIGTSDLKIWQGANIYMIQSLAKKASAKGTIQAIGSQFVDEKNYQQNKTAFVEKCKEKGIEWLNDLTIIIKNNNINVDDLCVVPDIYGKLHCSKDVKYNGAVLKEYQDYFSLIQIIDGDLWKYFDDSIKEEDDEGITSTIVHKDYVSVGDFQNNTDEKVFGLVNRLIEYCCNHESGTPRNTLKTAISVLLQFFEDNEGFLLSNSAKLKRLFPTMYDARKALTCDYIYDAETKARISLLNDSFSPDEIKGLINERETVKKILAKKDYYSHLEEENQRLTEKIEELSGITDVIKDCSPAQLSLIKDYIKELARNGSDAVIGASLNGDQLPTAKQIEENEEAKKLVLRKLEKEGFDISNVDSTYSVINGVTRNGANFPLVVKSCKNNPNNQEHRVWINPIEWQQLFKPNSMLWLHFGNGVVAPVKAFELFTYQDKLTLSFDTVNLMMEDRIHKILEVLHYFNKVKLDLATLNPNKHRADNFDEYLFNDNNPQNSDLDNNEVEL